MPPKKTTTSTTARASKPTPKTYVPKISAIRASAPRVSAPKSAPKSTRPAPTKVVRAAVAPHIKTTSNGSPRPKRRV